jgi:alkanesulfonate monooxygenase SsuD/methylene tetrahydromethanopterin reductase-like flavin-dependent oxidoreductase (luciferase family)
VQAPHPPIWIPSQGSGETIEWAAAPERKYPVIMAFSPTEAVIKFHGSYRQQAEKFGYEISGDQLGWSTPTYVAETDEIAARESAEHLEALFNNFFHIPPELLFPPGYTSIRSLQAMLETRKGLAAVRVSFHDLMTRGNVIVGSPATVQEKIEAIHAKTGFRIMVPMIQFGTLPDELVKKSTQMFAEEVAPKLRSL